MAVSDNLRKLRTELKLSQEEMGFEIGMSKNGYGNLERQGDNIKFKHIKHIAETFNVDIDKLIKEKGDVNFLIGDNNGNYANHYYDNQQEIEMLKLKLVHKDEIIAQKDKEIDLLRQLLAQKDK